MRAVTVVGMVLSSTLLGGCFTSMYVINRAQTAYLPEASPALDGLVVKNPQPQQQVELVVAFGEHAPIAQVLPAKIHYIAANCGFKSRSVEGLLQATYPQQTLSVTAEKTAPQTQRYRFYQDLFLPKQDEHGRNCRWGIDRIDLAFASKQVQAGVPIVIQMALTKPRFNQSWVQQQYFERTASLGFFQTWDEASAHKRPVDTFAITVRYQP